MDRQKSILLPIKVHTISNLWIFNFFSSEQTAPEIGYGCRSQKDCGTHLFFCFKVLAVTGLVHQDFRVDKVAPKDNYFQHYFCGMFSQ
jgi:hypothetical protein